MGFRFTLLADSAVNETRATILQGPYALVSHFGLEDRVGASVDRCRAPGTGGSAYLWHLNRCRHRAKAALPDGKTLSVAELCAITCEARAEWHAMADVEREAAQAIHDAGVSARQNGKDRARVRSFDGAVGRRMVFCRVSTSRLFAQVGPCFCVELDGRVSGGGASDQLVVLGFLRFRPLRRHADKHSGGPVYS